MSRYKEWAYAMTHIEAKVLMDVDNPKHRNYRGAIVTNAEPRFTQMTLS